MIIKFFLKNHIFVAFREKPKSFSHKLQKSTTFWKLAKNKRTFERYFISYQTPFYLFIIMAHPVCIPVYLKYHNSMPYKFGQDDSGWCVQQIHCICHWLLTPWFLSLSLILPDSSVSLQEALINEFWPSNHPLRMILPLSTGLFSVLLYYNEYRYIFQKFVMITSLYLSRVLAFPANVLLRVTSLQGYWEYNSCIHATLL